MSNLAIKTNYNVEIPTRFLPFLTDDKRFKVAVGGRYSLKSWNIARALILKAIQSKKRILCTRELQTSIKDSVHRLLCDQIEAMGFAGYADTSQNSIKFPHTGSEFIFMGLRYNAADIKSMEGIDIAWVEEAEKTTENSWQILIPTIRKQGSEIWVSYNLDQETDPTHVRFYINGANDPNVLLIESSWRYAEACGLFTDEMRLEKDYMMRVDYDAYMNIWEGQPRQRSDAQVLNGKWRIDTFEPGDDWDGPYYGADWGFSVDPTVLTRCWIHGLRLYVEYEAYKVGCEIRDTKELFMKVPGAESHMIRADNARPETIKHVSGEGLHVVAADKWAGSVQDGITFLRSFEEIVIHERCKHTIEEARLYSHKTDRLTKEVQPEIIDKHNHCWDAIRYSLAPLIKGGGKIDVRGGSMFSGSRTNFDEMSL